MVASQFDRRISRRPQTWVLQCGTWCGLNCRYCYLPNRSAKNLMSVAVASALADSATEACADGRVIDVVWHAGEPLGTGMPRFADLLGPFEHLRERGGVRHSIQTNATMITDSWCRFMMDYGFTVGVSIDGPEHLNTDRVDWHGKPSFSRSLRGVSVLQRQSVPFSIIAVVTVRSMAHPEEMLDFLASLGPSEIGLNIEEREGLNANRAVPTADQAVAFWRSVLDWSRHHPDVRVRETNRLGHQLRHLREHPDNPAPLIDPIPTVGWNGDVVLLSPELAGMSAPAYDDFRAGNILDRPMSQIIDEAPSLGYIGEFLDALDACESGCEFWAFCHGGQAGNRFFEHGRFDVAETNFCRTTRQALVRALSAVVREEMCRESA